MRKTDRRFQRTHVLIYSCFEQMFMTMDYEQITVSALCKYANINRKTFYHHYESMEALTMEMIRSIVGEIMEYLDNSVFSGKPLQINGMVTGFFHLLEKDRTLHKRILCSPGCYSIFEKCTELLLQDNKIRLQKYMGDIDFRQRTAMIFAAYSVLPIYREWLMTEPEMSESELGALVEELMLHGISSWLPGT